ncbi:MAG: GDSL-type esterase/lipase family protein, partial [Bacteroidota bacterium]|nr:GDSL-type esterase/lipase family protein [Bacteroidota bacterium]
FKNSGKDFAEVQRFERISLYYSNAKAPLAVQVFGDGKRWFEDSLPANNELAISRYQVDSLPREVKLQFAGTSSPDIYGVSFDCNKGIAVDNISMRGSSGTDFFRLDRALLAKHINQINARLIIFQFGVNVIPYVQDDHKYYAHRFYQELKAFRDNNPGVPILVVGVSDMSTTNKNGDHISYPHISLIRDAQREAAFRAGCAFWDLYAAMGGENSMVAWVNAKPKLAEPDYIHFNWRGARVVGEMMYNAMMHDYYSYEEQIF